MHIWKIYLYRPAYLRIINVSQLFKIHVYFAICESESDLQLQLCRAHLLPRDCPCLNLEIKELMILSLFALDLHIGFHVQDLNIYILVHHSGDKEAHHSCSKATAEIANSFTLLLHLVRLPNPTFRVTTF